MSSQEITRIANVAKTIVNPATAEKQDTIIANQTNGTQLTGLMSVLDPGNSSSTALPADTGGSDHIFTGDWFDTQNYAQFLVTVRADQYGDIYVERSANGTTVGKSVLVSSVLALSEGQRFADSPSARYIRIKFVNGPVAQTYFRLNTQFSTVPTGFSFHQLQQPQIADNMCLNTIANLSGERFDGTRAYVPLDNGNLLRVNTYPYTYSVSRGDIPGRLPLSVFGANTNTLTTQAIISDLAQSAYPYLTSAEILQVVSSSTSDAGTLLSTGTATGGSSTTLQDTTATFVTDGVGVGDLLINDTKHAHGIITALSETQLTVGGMHNTVEGVLNESGDTYRVATTASTGAAVISLEGVDANYDEVFMHVILNGTTNVPTSLSALRAFKMRVHLAGSELTNVGDIDAKNNAGTVSLARMSAARGQTLMAQWTVPNGKELYLTEFTVGEKTNKGSEFVLLARPYGEAFQTNEFIELLGSSFSKAYQVPKKFRARTDIEIRVTSEQAGGKVTASFDGWYEAI